MLRRTLRLSSLTRPTHSILYLKQLSVAPSRYYSYEHSYQPPDADHFLIPSLCRQGRFDDAFIEFEKQPDVLGATSLISHSAKHSGKVDTAFKVYDILMDYIKKNPAPANLPDDVFFVTIANACKLTENYKQAVPLYSMMEKLRIEHTEASFGVFVSITRALTDANLAKKMLRYLMEHPLTFKLHSRMGFCLFMTFIKTDHVQEAIDIFHIMQREKIIQNINYLYRSIFSAIIKTGTYDLGKSLFQNYCSSNPVLDKYISSTLITYLSRSKNLEGLEHILDLIKDQDVPLDNITFTCLFDGSSGIVDRNLSYKILYEYDVANLPLNLFTFASMVKLLTRLGDIKEAVEALDKVLASHGNFPDSEFYSTAFSAFTFIMTAMAKDENLKHKVEPLKQKAMGLYNRYAEANVLDANTAPAAIILLLKCDQVTLAFKLLQKCTELQLTQQKNIFAAVIEECGNYFALPLGMKVKDIYEQAKISPNLNWDNAVLDFYGKCGSMTSFSLLYNSMKKRDRTTLQISINSWAINKNSYTVLDIYRMTKKKVEYTADDFLSILLGLRNSGLTDKLLMMLKEMETSNVKVDARHYSMVVDGLARSGRWIEAEQMCKKVNLANTWLTLLEQCKTIGDVEIARRAASNISKLNPTKNEISLMHEYLFNFYKQIGDSKSQDAIKLFIDEQKMSTVFGVSSININEDIASFSGRWNQNNSEDITLKLDKVIASLTKAGHVFESKFYEGELLPSADLYSEFMAVACGLVYAPSTEPICVANTVPVSRSCHSALALVSRLEHRNIQLRDPHVLHSFENGKCTCEQHMHSKY